MSVSARQTIRSVLLVLLALFVSLDAAGFRRPIRRRFFGVFINNVSPSTGCPGDGVAISGGGFSGTTSVTFNGTAASFIIQSSSMIAAQVPNGATTGTIHVTTPLGSATSSTFTVSGCAFDFDLTNCSNLPSGVTGSRTGADVYVMNGSTSTTTARTAASGFTCEDQGGGTSGTWVFAGFSNDAPGVQTDGSTNFTAAGWSTVGTVNVTANAAADPSGTNKASNLQVPFGSNPSTQISTAAGPNTADYGAASVWVRDGSPVETAAGAISPRGDSGSSSSLRTGVPWRHAFAAWKKSDVGTARQVINLFPTGAASPFPQAFNSNFVPTFDAAASGGDYMWGAQAWNVVDFGLPPLVAGASTGNSVLAVNNFTGILDSNSNFHIEIAALMDPYFVESSTAIDDTAPYIWSMATAGGLWGSRYGGATVVTTLINGSVAAGSDINIGDLTYAQLNAAYEMQLEVWSRPNAPFNDAGLHMKINGAWSAVQGQVALTPTQVQTPVTGFWLGSKSGTSNFLARAFTFLRRQSNDPLSAEGVMLGDSLTSIYSSLTGVHGWIQTLAEGRVRPGIISYAYPGETIGQQQTRWDNSPQKGQSYVKWVFILLGQNNIDPAVGNQTDVTAAAALQSLVNDIHAANPTAKILLATNLPTNCAFSATVQGYYANFNNDIIGTGPNPITDPGGGVLVRFGLWTQLAGGTTPSTYCYLSQYNNGDNIHENDAGRQIVGSTGTQSVRAVLIANGLL